MATLRLDHVIGHERVKAALERAWRQGRLVHAYLFAGPPQVGKRLLALELLRALNCSDPAPPCGRCRSCRLAAGGQHPDIRLFGLAESEGGGRRQAIAIEQVRALEHDCTLKPYLGAWKGYIIDEAERLSLPAANALLKTLEEPPPHVIIILVSRQPEALLPTLVSRCQTLRFGLLATAVIERALIERFGAAPPDAALLARLAQGRLGWAVAALSDRTLLDERQSALADLERLLGAETGERLAYAEHWAQLVGRDPDRALARLDCWLGWWRDLIFLHLGCPDLVVNVDREATLRALQATVPLATARAVASQVAQTADYLAQNVNPRLALESLVLALPRR